MTSKNVIGNPTIKKDFYTNGDNINFPCHSDSSEEPRE